MLLGAAGAVPMRSETGDAPATLVPMGLVFLTIGGILVFGRQWLVLDLRRRSILRQIGLLVPFSTKERALAEFDAVIISYNLGDSESAETYPVRLRSSTGKDAAIIKPLQFAESLATAEYLARELSLQLIDATTDREARISPERAGESLRERMSRASAGTTPQRPPAMRSEVTESAAETRIVTPGGNPTLVGYVGVVLPIVVFLIAMIIATPFMVRSANPIALLCVLLFLFGAPTAFAGIRFMISNKRKAITLTASNAGLVIEQPMKGKTQSTVIPARDVFDVDYSTIENVVASARHSVYPPNAESSGNERVLGTLRKLVPNPGIVIKSRAGLIKVGEGLPTDELQYLVWLIRKALTG